MANITEHLKKILTARYGRDVRQSIYDSIDAINTQVTECENSAYNSAKSALKSASEAKTSEANAALSASNAAQSEENAGTSETNAKVSENNAASYALSASTSANNAAQSETNATLLASNAAQSELNAQTSATNAQISENNAKTYESNTALNAANAQTSADNASTSASNAAQSATDASTSANNAQECYEKSQEIYDNFQSAGSVTGVKGSAEETYRTGQVEITAENIGLGNVPNVATNDQTPTYTTSSSLTDLSSGEKLNVAFGKLAKAVQYLSTCFEFIAGEYSPLGFVSYNEATIPAHGSATIGMQLDSASNFYKIYGVSFGVYGPGSRKVNSNLTKRTNMLIPHYASKIACKNADIDVSKLHIAKIDSYTINGSLSSGTFTIVNESNEDIVLPANYQGNPQWYAIINLPAKYVSY